jgi:hypothetical protein
MPIDVVLGRLRALGKNVTGCGPWRAICPAHLDSKPSLSISERHVGIYIINCYTRFAPEQVLDRLDLEFRDLYPSLFALQHSGRQPRDWQSHRSGRTSEKIVDVTPAECAQWRRLLKHRQLSPDTLNQIAVQLGLPRDSIRALRVGYDAEQCVWVFPERDHRNRIVGLLRRDDYGIKVSMTGSARGLTIPQYPKRLPSGPLYVCEGATDTAALHSVGRLALGRSTAGVSAREMSWLVRFLHRHPKWHVNRDIVAVGDRDSYGLGARRACQLAHDLRTALDRPVSWALPAKKFKDVREQIVAKKWKSGLIITETEEK